MNTYSQEQPPSYGKFQSVNQDIRLITFSIAEVVEKLTYPASNSRAAIYTTPSSQEIENVSHTAVNVTMPNNHEIQFFPPTPIGQEPVQCTCPNCHSFIRTSVRHRDGLLVWLSCGVLIFVGCICGCCLIPFCIPNIKNYQHYCPQCKAVIGEYRPL
ncbi:unnamed protein product [Rotaria sp. Silwood2]|nr:unnamed protein product [Rotaria sp. Silwood2]CAF3028146.1 unnamed protein product [Rotaria sp. Silwood2]CAF3184152.1 unnamed protein product [Rotaria sp. Silwood2]CAF4054693.1 unnamed protein product [Rotaria sp. Silwood2]CAF4294039.1 unnamed protein product [Rotaria sp. Silwood2]